MSGATNKASRWTPMALSLPALALFALMVLLPLALTALLSFQQYDQDKGVQSGFTLASYALVLGDAYYYEIFFRTGWIAALTTLICVLVGAPEAYIL
ncbi:MAG: ABC transporter permease, partial [Burkholderiales bacterium]